MMKFNFTEDKFADKKKAAEAAKGPSGGIQATQTDDSAVPSTSVSEI